MTSDLPIAVTRKMYWPSPLQPGGWGEASDAAGITTTTLKAYIARAMVGGPDQAATYVLIANTSADAGQIQITADAGRRRRRSSRPIRFPATRG